MIRKIPLKSRDFIEAECLRVARLQVGCRHLKGVKIRRTKPIGSGPNWEVLAFVPELPPIARKEAMNALDVLRGTYALAATS